MKRFKVLGLVAVMLVFGMMALGSGSESSSDKKEIVEEDSNSSDITVDTSDVDTTDSSDTDSSSSAAITIEEQVLFEQDDLKVTATEYVVDSIWGDGIKLLIENNGTSDIGLGCNALIVNDVMVYFHTFDSESYMTISDIDCVTIKTSAFDTMDTTPNDAGQELYNADGIRIVGKYVDEGSFWGAAVLLYIENNSGKNRIIQCDDMSVNGFMVTPYFSSTVYDGKKAIDDITLMSSELEENNITSIDEIELKFKIIDEDFMNSIESDTITFSAKQ